MTGFKELLYLNLLSSRIRIFTGEGKLTSTSALANSEPVSSLMALDWPS